MSASYFPGTRRPAETFLSAEKSGSDSESVARDGAILASIALQFGAGLDILRHAATRAADGGTATAIGQALDLLAVLDMNEEQAP